MAGAAGIGSLGVAGVVGVTGAGCSGWTGVSGWGWGLGLRRVHRIRRLLGIDRLFGIDRNFRIGRQRNLAEVRPSTLAPEGHPMGAEATLVVPSSFSSHSYSSAVRPGSSSITSCWPQGSDDLSLPPLERNTIRCAEVSCEMSTVSSPALPSMVMVLRARLVVEKSPKSERCPLLQRSR